MNGGHVNNNNTAIKMSKNWIHTLSSCHSPVYMTPLAEVCLPAPLLINTPDADLLHSPSVEKRN